MNRRNFLKLFGVGGVAAIAAAVGLRERPQARSFIPIHTFRSKHTVDWPKETLANTSFSDLPRGAHIVQVEVNDGNMTLSFKDGSQKTVPFPNKEVMKHFFRTKQG